MSEVSERLLIGVEQPRSGNRFLRDDLAFEGERASRILAETSLLDMREHVELRERFISVLAHDLRNPLSVITMALQQLLSADDLALAHRKTLSRAATNAGRMARRFRNYWISSAGSRCIRRPLGPLLPLLRSRSELWWNDSDYDLRSNITFATKRSAPTSPELRRKVPRYASRGRACVCSSFARGPFRSTKSLESVMPKAAASDTNVLI